MPIPYLACMLMTASFYHLPPRVLPAIQAVEDGYVGAEHANSNGSVDLGLMQINTLWVEPVSGVVHQTPDKVRDRLVKDACFNIAAAGAIMRLYLNEENGNLLRAVGDYNSHLPTFNQKYQQKILVAAKALFDK